MAARAVKSSRCLPHLWQSPASQCPGVRRLLQSSKGASWCFCSVPKMGASWQSLLWVPAFYMKGFTCQKSGVPVRPANLLPHSASSALWDVVRGISSRHTSCLEGAPSDVIGHM